MVSNLTKSSKLIKSSVERESKNNTAKHIIYKLQCILILSMRDKMDGLVHMTLITHKSYKCVVTLL